MFGNIDFSPGVIFCDVTNDASCLKDEDIFQVRYENLPIDLVIDLGWYRTNYAIMVIKDMDWTEPLLVKKCTEVSDLEYIMNECALFVRMLLRNSLS
ncbi:hypothetical protein SAMN05661091_3202 [Paenibacillus uliginis N3/975]|uniref:Uncharacterized protein n=1 Tax=Paenibacillus uliginis N3/975 TaxID=1313296 RepID=A0A1X7HFW8_9BACL|nr:hypothetical protein [Paenibacillus uliginis]SMF85876.1 hypothetical protein SAMN05661091_3202 [Paenibacillus uliginis N3/975]